MGSSVQLWTPPEGMRSVHVAEWRSFYSRMVDQYDVTPKQYRLLYIAQKGRGLVCRVAKGIHPDDPKARGSRRLGVDHDHATGKVRGLLCTGGDRTCNRIIGWLPAAALHRAADYLSGNEPARVFWEVDRQHYIANQDGVELSDADMDKLAVNYLWPDEQAA